MAQVLLCNFKGRRLKGALAAAAALSAETREVAVEEQVHTIGYLLGFDGFTPSSEPVGDGFKQELVVMYGFDDGKLEAFLSLLNAVKPSARPIKAMVTAHNMTWSALELYRELAAERLAIEAMMRR